MGRPKLTLEQRESAFWSCVATGSIEDCWPWIGPINVHSYGAAPFDGTVKNASRVAWILTYGDPGKLSVLHKCDVRICCNPQHLWCGTQRDNMRDMIEKKRGRGQFKAGNEHPRYNR